MSIAKEEIKQILVDFIMYEKQTMSFYTEEDANEYLKLYLSTLK